MNIKKIFIASLKTVQRSRMPQVVSGSHFVREAGASLGAFFSDTGWKKLSDKNGNIRIYGIARDFFAFNIREVSVSSFEKYLESVSASNALTGAELSCSVDIFKLAALEKFSECCEMFDKNGESPDLAEKARNLISYLSLLEKYDGVDLYEKFSVCERVLCKDKQYSLLDKETKNLYRHRVSVIAKQKGLSELSFAEQIVSRASSSVGKRAHIGYYLFEKKECPFYIPLLFILPAVVSAGVGALTRSVIGAVLSYLPLFEITKILTDRIFGSMSKAEYIPRLEKHGKKTLVTIVTFISSSADVDKYADRLKKLYYTNRTPDGNTLFGFLCDLPESDSPSSPDDEIILKRVKERISKLNCELENVFFAAVRKRSYNDETGKYSAYERKRGAITEFLHAVKNHDNDRFIFISDNTFDAEFFVSLDSDTFPEPESIAKLVCVLSHPLSEPIFNADMSAVTEGYAIAVPRIDVSLKSATENRFTKIISCFGGTEVYENVSFDFYQDIFGEGIFSGKGAINIDAFNKITYSLFPDNRVLSHDILEGCFLRAVNVSDAVFSDSVPKNIVSYLKRSHRWIRGDWQNIRWLFGALETKNGEEVKNPLGKISKFKLFDNLRRSLTALAVFILLLFALLTENVPLALLGVFSAFATPITVGLFGLFELRESRYIRHKTARAVSGTEDFLFSFINFICLPTFAFSSVDAVVRAVYRSFVSGKKLLEWTPADVFDRKIKGSFWETFILMLPQFAGTVFFFRPMFIPIGVLWLIAPLVMRFLSKTEQKEHRVEHPEFFTECMADIWKYFETFLNDRNNYLPPDNFQEAPIKISAERTSPTNIGLALLCTVGARDMGFISPEKMFSLLKKQISSLESLETVHGHFLNWYSTASKKALYPRFISTVDNGNLAVCLYSLKNALLSFGGDDARELAECTEKLLKQSDFMFLYDKKRNLFRIGYDVENGKFTDSHYDLYASESRLTSYFAVAMGVVPKKHWASLDRFYTLNNGFLGMKSWSGTMFEYFMPHLFLPVSECSIDEEMLRFALESQKSAVPYGVPWGISESAYYAFDRELNYQYRAFGVRELSAKGGFERKADCVVSPYSSFITLPMDNGGDVKKNLDLFSKIGAKGEFGYYDAVDYPSFSASISSVVMNSMVHHLGMSFLACENYLKNNIVVRRFMDERMSSFSGLLEQRPPSSIVRYSEHHTEPKNKNDRYRPLAEDCVPVSTEHPTVRTLTGGGLTDIITDSGNGYLYFDGKCVIKARDTTKSPKGVFAMIRVSDTVLPFTFAPLYDGKAQYKTVFEDGKFVFYAKNRYLEGSQSVTVDPISPYEIREFSVKSNLRTEKMGEFLFYLEPVLLELMAERSHPAFSSLFLEAFFDKQNNIIFIHRRPRDGVTDDGQIWLAVGCNNAFEFELSRFSVLKRGLAERSLPDAFDIPFSCKTDGPIDACVALRVKTDVSTSSAIRVYLAVGRSREDALLAVLKAKEKTFSQIAEKNAAATFRAYEAVSAKKEEIGLYGLILSRIFSVKKHENNAAFGGEEVLWKYGVSGDYPMILVKADQNNIQKCIPFIKVFILLKNADVPCELAMCFSEGGGYERRIWNTLRSYFRELSMEDLLDRRNGAFLLNISDVSDFNVFRSASSFYVDLSADNAIKPQKKAHILSALGVVEPKILTYNKKMGLGGFVNGGFGIDDKEIFPYRPVWSHVLANPVFGTVLTENGLGFTFAKNSSLNKITPWSGDAVCGCNGERLIMICEGQRYDLLSAASVSFLHGRAEYCSSVCGTEVTVKVFVPKSISAKIIVVSVENSGSEKKISFCSDILMDSQEKACGTICENSVGAMFFTNRFNSNFPDGCAFVCGEKTGENEAFFTVDEGKKKTSFFVLGYEKNRACAESVISSLDIYTVYGELERIEQSKPCVEIKTPCEELDLFYNTFLLSQIVNSRIYARSGFYQCGGAFGFRDQLQDCICISSVEPRFLKKQILRASSRQFIEGDVFHWWHDLPSGPKGSRARFSDDLLWLPYAVCEYVEKVGSDRILWCEVEYLVGRPLEDNENEAYIEAALSEKSESVFLHCVRAIKKACTFGSHGLVLFGCGDWNDGMNGIKGGESVFTTMFAIIVLERFSALCDRLGEREMHDFCTECAVRYREAVEKYCYDNDRFVRGFFADGAPFGSSENVDCKVDLLPQSFAAVAGGFDYSKVKTALETAEKYLVDRKNGIIKLFAPPFCSGSENPGYIKGYVSGVRENGGQYTHAAVWFSLAHIKSGQTDKAFELLDMLNPVNHTKTLDDVKKYRGEPYVLSADVYSNSAHEGMAGWSQYTGAAGWYFKVVTEEILGIKRKNGALVVEPSLPSSWNGYSAQMDVDGTNISLAVENSGELLFVDGIPSENIPLDGKRHTVKLVKNTKTEG